MKPLIATITGSLIILLLLSFTSIEQKPGPGKTGQELFEKHCKQCHGKMAPGDPLVLKFTDQSVGR